MKVFFLNPPDMNQVYEYSPDEKSGEYIGMDNFGTFPPLGIMYVMAYLEKSAPHHKIYFKDSVAERSSHKDLIDYVAEIKPDIVAMTSFTVSMIDVVIAAQNIRKIVPNAHICLGGHHPISFPFEAATLPEFDSIVVGEGEIVFTELVKRIEDKKPFTDILGVYTNESIQKYRNTILKDRKFLNKVGVPPAYVDDIDSLPMPNRNYIKHLNYNSVVGVSSKLATLISSRGCPYKCTFCNVPFKTQRRRDPKLVVDEMEICVAQGYEEIHFYDDLFNITPRRVIDICDEIDKRNLKVVWDFRGRVNGIDEESIKRFKKAGGRLISFGIETATQEGLKLLRKGSKIKQNIDALKLCKKYGIVTLADFMIGLPHERSYDDVLKNIKTLTHDYRPDYAQFSILNLYPNTEVHDQAVAKGLIKNGKWNEWAKDPLNSKIKVDHWDEFVTWGQLLELQKKAYRIFYLRPTSIWNMMKQLRSFDELWIKIKGGLDVLGIKFNLSVLKNKLFKSNNKAPIGNTGISFKSK
jgi:radical SAM superfamily enzyme YgiQ (UPF0313 family)